ncbi:hypothetical protein GCM10010124_21110 [Pilimelia terevasa]|uniref:SGNH hydrolase-type esterase domain-containing protein n=1 Tax=Pilimelia terevasa TaxID=53372 RepID=A0A8J3BQS3_9ACTN|nr:SGNH/GDSL hydrolase family protein [Pilimelia terevasa]GGK28238.1 hypothetical protein GCM10010124_21110 [Pilimelia terevasa]
MSWTRRRLLTALGGGTGALLLPAGAAAADAPVRIMALGDSLTSGTGSSDGTGWRRYLAALLTPVRDVAFVGSRRGVDSPDHEGHPGLRLAQAADRAPDWLAAAAPELVLLHLGTNDMKIAGRERGATARLAGLLATLWRAAPDALVLVSTLVGSPAPAVQRRIAAYNATIPGLVAASYGRAALVRMDAVDPAVHLGDNLHPNDLGYAAMADCWNAVLAPLLAPR